MVRRTIAAALISGVATQGLAATTTVSFAPSITIVGECLVSGGTLDFGTQALLSVDVDATGSIAVTCNKGTAFAVRLDSGLNSGAITNRKMKHTVANSTIRYDIYRDASRLLAWGDTVLTSYIGIATGDTQSLPVYGRVQSQNTPQSGLYTDTVTVTVIY